jgi:hypothetical protein
MGQALANIQYYSQLVTKGGAQLQVGKIMGDKSENVQTDGNKAFSVGAPDNAAVAVIQARKDDMYVRVFDTMDEGEPYDQTSYIDDIHVLIANGSQWSVGIAPGQRIGIVATDDLQ